MWRHQREVLEARGIHVIAVDLPGHGRRMDERFTLGAAMQTIGDAVADATAATGTPPYLVGFSLGGYLSIDWAARHPGAICGLLAASCGTVPHRIVIGGWRLLAKGIHRLPDRGRWLNDTALRSLVPSPGADDVLAGGVALEVMDDVLVDLLRVDPVTSLAKIEMPVLFVNGQFDHIRWHAARYLAAVADGRLVTIPGASHMVSAAKPEAFTRELLRGLADAAGRAAPESIAD